MAQAVLARLELMVEGDSLIKHETLTLPAALLFRHLLQIVENAALKMMNLGESPLLQKAAGLLTTNSTGTEHGDARRRRALNQRAEMLFHPVRKIPETVSCWIQRTHKTADGHLIGIAGVDDQRVGVIHQLIPIARVHVGPHIAAGISTRLSQAHNLALATGLETTERLAATSAPLHLKALEMGIPKCDPAAQALQDCGHALVGTADRAIHTFWCQQH